MKLEIVVDDKDAEMVIDAICDTVQTGEVGDGKIFVFDLQQVVRIRTGETGADAV